MLGNHLMLIRFVSYNYLIRLESIQVYYQLSDRQDKEGLWFYQIYHYSILSDMKILLIQSMRVESF